MKIIKDDPSKPEDVVRNLRAQVDRVDHELLRLINQRASLVLELMRYKRSQEVTERDPVREQEIIRDLRWLNTGPLDKLALERIFGMIMTECRRIVGLL